MANEKKAPKAQTARDALRGKLLGSAPKAERKLITLFGHEIELRQPTLQAILEAQDIEEETERSVHMIIEYSYVPGTAERLFESTDKDVILQWPFGDDLLTLQLTIAELTGVDISDAEEDLKENPLKEQS